MDRIHTKTLTRGQEHLDAATSLIRGARMAASPVQEEAARAALAEIEAAKQVLGSIGRELGRDA